MYIKREMYWERIKDFVNTPLIKIITGMRRVGKSCFLKQIIDELKRIDVSAGNILYIDKEDMKFDFIQTYKHLNSYVEDGFAKQTGRKHLLIDEVQEIAQWEKAETARGFLPHRICFVSSWFEWTPSRDHVTKRDTWNFTNYCLGSTARQKTYGSR